MGEDKKAGAPDAQAGNPPEVSPLAPAASTNGPSPENAGPSLESQAPTEPSELGSSVAFRGVGRRNDGTVEVSIAEDWMSATAVFSPPLGEGLPIDQDYVRNLLERLGLGEGVLWDDIAEALLACNLDRRVIRDRVIAKGISPEEEIPEHATLEERFRQKIPIVPETAPRVDYKELSSLIVVRKGETLARIIPRQDGKEGRDLRGKSIPAPRRSVENHLPGKNVVTAEGALVAGTDGLLSMSEKRLDIEEILLVKGAVDYHTGHIVFPGDVVIEGNVGDGFKVWSGGSIICKSTMDAFDVNAKRDLLCSQGIIGKRKARIRVGGELRAKFIQNCKVAVRGDLHVVTAIVNSRIYSLGTLDLGDRGVFMGGEAYAVHGIRAGRLGNQAQQRTIVHAGTDFTIQQRLDQANERLRILALRAQQVDVLAAGRGGARADRLREEVEKSVLETRTLIGQLLDSLDADENAIVEVRGDIYPGTVIEICRVRIVIDEVLKACRFRLDKAAGRLLIEHLGATKPEPAPKTSPTRPTTPPSA